MGYDIHRLVPGRKLVLGGVEIEHVVGLEGHSDADVILHALMDALLGAAALGDIGHYFPPLDPRYREASSIELLREVSAMLNRAGWQPVNVDVVLVAEAPPLAPHALAIRRTIAAVLDMEMSAVGIKATTNEGLGPEGRGEAMSARAVVLVDTRQ